MKRQITKIIEKSLCRYSAKCMAFYLSEFKYIYKCSLKPFPRSDSHKHQWEYSRYNLLLDLVASTKLHATH